MSKGKVHKKAIVLCEDCMKFFKTCESLANYKKGTGNASNDIGDMLGNMFGGGQNPFAGK
jgi:hypothetical protein